MSNNDNWGDMLAKPIAVLEEHGLSIREINVLEEQLIWVDVAYFAILIDILRWVKRYQIDYNYIKDIIDKVFNN